MCCCSFGIVNNLDKSLMLVEEAKRAKIAKLQCEERLIALRRELEEVQKRFRHEQENITKIFPEICGCNDVITTLKERRVKLYKAATALGKISKGSDYR